MTDKKNQSTLCRFSPRSCSTPSSPDLERDLRLSFHRLSMSSPSLTCSLLGNLPLSSLLQPCPLPSYLLLSPLPPLAFVGVAAFAPVPGRPGGSPVFCGQSKTQVPMSVKKRARTNCVTFLEMRPSAKKASVPFRAFSADFDGSSTTKSPIPCCCILVQQMRVLCPPTLPEVLHLHD